MAMPDRGLIEVDVVYALPGDQQVFKARVPQGATVREVILRSGVLERHPELATVTCVAGVYGERVEMDSLVAAGDRVEIYRPLIADPKETRRRRAAKRAGR
jgi:putative ubiquitin-RnfH superfamily antitoxin RatB of RatAB toxin-antitoxin module